MLKVCFILSSIGGPRMLSPIFSGPIPEDVAYVVIQRMATGGLLDVLIECLREDLNRKTLIAGHTLQLQAGAIHFLPNERNYSFDGDKLVAADVPGKSRLCLDHLFAGAAKLPNPCAVAVLSGMLTDEDGLAGLAAMSARGISIVGTHAAGTPVFDMIEQLQAGGLMGELFPPKHLLEHLQFRRLERKNGNENASSNGGSASAAGAVSHVTGASPQGIASVSPGASATTGGPASENPVTIASTAATGAAAGNGGNSGAARPAGASANGGAAANTSTAGASTTAGKASGNGSSGAPRILVADDDPGIRTMVGDMLKLNGVHPEFAADGLDALRKIQKGKYDALILDLQMPEMDGIKTLEALKTIDPALPIVILTGIDDAAKISAAKEFNILGILHKPFAWEKLKKLLPHLRKSAAV